MKNTIKGILTIIMIMILCIIICSPKILAVSVTPDQITGGNFANDIDLDFVDDITNLLRTVGIFLAVGVMMVLGIKYITGSLEEKATYKKTMVPYLIGCFFIFSASAVAPQIIDLFKDAKDTESVGNVALGLIRIIGSFVAVRRFNVTWY